jgi:4a-hydroxytetrahydrobiopterin dehydratase
MAERMSRDEIIAAVQGLPGVHRTGTELRLRVEARSFPAAVSLVSAVGEVAEQANHHPDIDIRWRKVTFTLSTHSAGGVTDLDVQLADRILGLAAATGATVIDPPDRIEIALDALDADAIRPFWRAGLGYAEVEVDGELELHHPDGAGPVLWFQKMDPPRPGRGRFHLDVHVTAEQAPRRLEEAIAAGGRLVTDAYAPRWWVLADDEGNEMCITTP